MLKMKFSVLPVFCLLLSILLYAVYPASSDDEHKEEDNQKTMRDQIKEIFDKATDLMKEGFKKCEDEVQKTAQGSWTSFGDSAKKETEKSLWKVEELVKMMKSHVDDAMKEGHDHFQKMMDKAKESSDNMKEEAGKSVESIMDKAKKLLNP